MKHEADQVLSEVTRKKAEARKQLNMLKALEKLRRIRAQTVIRRGEHINAETGDQFEKVIGMNNIFYKLRERKVKTLTRN